ncbi:MAG: response regulator transcription factor, partial [Leadbetterella sp.]
DDYITKPFSIEELVLRIHIFLKRSGIAERAQTDDIYQLGNYVFIYSQQVLQIGTTHSKLTQRESEVLKFLCDRKNQIAKREDILKAIWGRDDYFLGRSMDVFVTRIRKMLLQDSGIKIENIHGVGFKLTS